MPRRGPGFLYAPEPVEDELLSSWVHRIALRQEVNGSTLVGRIDVDWDPPSNLLAYLDGLDGGLCGYCAHVADKVMRE